MSGNSDNPSRADQRGSCEKMGWVESVDNQREWPLEWRNRRMQGRLLLLQLLSKWQF